MKNTIEPSFHQIPYFTRGEAHINDEGYIFVKNPETGQYFYPDMDDYQIYLSNERPYVTVLGWPFCILKAMQKVFFPDSPPGTRLYPKDGNPYNVKLSNLVLRPLHCSKNKMSVKCNELDMRFSTPTVCARMLNLDLTAVTRVLNGKRKSHQGLTFSYDEGLDNLVA